MNSGSRSAPPPRRPAWRACLIHGLRVALVAAVFWLMHDQHRRHSGVRAEMSGRRITVADVQRFFPQAVALSEPARDGRQLVLDGTAANLGYVLQTSPASDVVAGFSGPTNCLLAFDLEHRTVGVQILDSRDTVEHVSLVQRDPRFLAALQRRTWRELATGAEVDGVSGATLTSLAIREGIAVRLGGQPPNLRFPRELTVEELKDVFPGIERLSRRADGYLWDAWRGTERLGSVLRSSPFADQRIGYQGPTDTLLVLDPTERVREIRLRDTFDNEPYVQYVREDEYFRGVLRGRSLKEIAGMSIPPPSVEGVSGATMTSQAMAAGVVDAARGVVSHWEISAVRVAQPWGSGAVWRWRDWGTLAVVALGIITAATRLRGLPAWRVPYQLVLIGYLGFCNADLLSQAQLVGWAQSGTPWRLAPGLVVLTVVSLISPIATKRQLYCQQLCPYGAVQQLVRLKVPWRWRLGRRVSRFLAIVPGILLAMVVGSAMWGWPISLSRLEPFDAFVFWVASGSTIALALGGVVFSAVVPMGYCRFGCPTGAMLAYLRRHGASDEWGWRDLFCGVLLLLSLAAWFRS